VSNAKPAQRVRRLPPSAKSDRALRQSAGAPRLCSRCPAPETPAQADAYISRTSRERFIHCEIRMEMHDQQWQPSGAPQGRSNRQAADDPNSHWSIAKINRLRHTSRAGGRIHGRGLHSAPFILSSSRRADTASRSTCRPRCGGYDFPVFCQEEKRLFASLISSDTSAIP
jgi:hypothetical protein